MIRASAAPATLPPPGLPGLDPAWSRLVSIRDTDGISRTFHVLDSWAERSDQQPAVTLLCLHGNPTWSYLWRELLSAAPAGWRVVAPDHLGMGYSERLDRPRVLAERIEDLDRLTAALQIDGPVVTVAHDWGGIISMGWAARHLDRLRAVVLTNTAVHQPAPGRGPVLIRLAHRRWINQLACRLTPLFVRTTTNLTWPRPSGAVRAAFAAPYRTVSRRAPVAEFVRDIPFAAGHPSHPTVASIAEGMRAMAVPALLMWGPRDPVFGETYLRDIQDRLPQAVLHRFEKASHLLPQDAPQYATGVIEFVSSLDEPVTPSQDAVATGFSPLEALARRAGDQSPAVVEVGGRTISWAELQRRVAQAGAGLRAAGVGPGRRVALLVPPSIELTVALYAVWAAGGVIVVADRGLGLRGLGRALRSARLDHLIAQTPGLLAARALRLPGVRVAVGSVPAAVARLAGVRHTLADSGSVVRGPGSEVGDEAAVLFTSGATGPAKGVLYRQRQVQAQLALVTAAYALTPDDRLVAAFAPFALFGPALGIPSAVPNVDVTKPSTLTAAALGEAAVAVGATVVFASPAALRNVLATESGVTPEHREALARIRLVASFGAPVPADLLRALGRLLPAASMRTPYGMTEAFPLTDISLQQIDAAGDGDGVCVGRPLDGVELRVAALDHTGVPGTALITDAGISGEVWARAAHIRDRYDTLWLQNHAAAEHPGWHRTGDTGYLDADGRLWIQGRMEHVIRTADGPVTPVGIEQRVERSLARTGPRPLAAAVGVGPAGVAQVVVVLTGSGPVLAGTELTDRVRAAAGVPVAAVLVRSALPLDIRHNSKIDRAAVARWAEKVLAGG